MANPTIRIYGPVGDADEGVTSKMIAEELEAIGSDVDEIDVKINSQGGSVSQGIAIAGLFSQHPAKIHTIIEGGAYSIAGYIACCGDRRSIASNSPLHIHGPRVSSDVGTLQEHEDAISELKIATDAMAKRYSKVTGQTIEQITSQFHRDRFYSATEAVEAGYMTHVIDESVMAAEFVEKHKSLFPERFAAAVVDRNQSGKSDEVDTMSKTTAATPKELRNKFKHATAEFLLEQIEAGATMPDATSAYIKTIEARVIALEESEAGLKEKLEAMESDDEESDEDVIASLKAELAKAHAKIGSTAMDDDDEATADDDEATADDDEATADDDEAEAMDDDATEIEALRAELRAELVALKKDRKKKGKRRMGATARRTSKRGSAGAARKTARAEVDRRVAAKMESDKTLTRANAFQSVYKEDPKLRERLVEETNV